MHRSDPPKNKLQLGKEIFVDETSWRRCSAYNASCLKAKSASAWMSKSRPSLACLCRVSRREKAGGEKAGGEAGERAGGQAAVCERGQGQGAQAKKRLPVSPRCPSVVEGP